MDETQLFRALIREYLFVSLYRAFAESLASENASRLASMQVAERNIDDRSAPADHGIAPVPPDLHYLGAAGYYFVV